MDTPGLCLCVCVCVSVSPHLAGLLLTAVQGQDWSSESLGWPVPQVPREVRCRTPSYKGLLSPPPSHLPVLVTRIFVEGSDGCPWVAPWDSYPRELSTGEGTMATSTLKERLLGAGKESAPSTRRRCTQSQVGFTEHESPPNHSHLLGGVSPHGHAPVSGRQPEEGADAGG